MQSSAQDCFGLGIICPIRLVEGSTWTVAPLELHVQFLGTHHLAFEQKTLDLGTAECRFVDPVVRSTIRCVVHGLFYLTFISTPRRLVGLFLRVFAKSSDCYRSPFWQLLFYTLILPLCRVSVICRRVALSLLRNQIFSHDYMVRVSALSAFSSAVSLRPPQCVRLYGNVYRIVCIFVLLVLTRCLLGLSVLVDSMSDCSHIPVHCPNTPFSSVPLSELRCCDRDLVSTIGGGRPYLFPGNDVGSSVTQGGEWLTPAHVFRFVDHVDDVNCLAYPSEHGFVYAKLALTSIVSHISRQMVQKIARIHKVALSSHWHLTKDELVRAFEGHDCINCSLYTSVLEAHLSPSVRRKKSAAEAFARLTVEEKTKRNKRNNERRGAEPVAGTLPSVFPPSPLTKELGETVIRKWCKETKPSSLEESGCAVCGELVPMSRLSRLKAVKTMLSVLAAPGVTRIERKSVTQAVSEFKGPVLDYRCDKICDDCRKVVRKGKVPHLALANNLWLGEVPNVLSELNYVERLLVARIRHNCCFVKVASSGLKKMVAHVIAFESPLPKVYHTLPPPVEEMDDVLAILFTGPLKPTEQDLSRIPLLVRRNHVGKALEWLKLNHVDYKDLDISYENLGRYPEDTPPVSVEYRREDSNKVAEGTSAFDNEVNDGVATGECPFIVHGLTGMQLDTKTVDAQKALALQHWSNN